MIRHGPVGGAAEAAAAPGVEVRDPVKTLMVRRADGGGAALHGAFADVTGPRDGAVSCQT